MQEDQRDSHNCYIAISTDISALADALENFDHRYQRDYFVVRAAAQNLLFCPGIEDEGTRRRWARAVAKVVIPVLRRWGTNKRAAPLVRSESELEAFLADTKICEKLRILSEVGSGGLSVHAGKRVTRDSHTPDDLDGLAIDVLVAVAKGFFERCHRVTYPSKVILLLTGYMVAIDGRVRLGAQRAGFTGMSASFPMEDLISLRKSAAKKLTALPYLLGRSWPRMRGRVSQALELTGRDDLVGLLNHPVRTLDILFFMQGKNAAKSALAPKLLWLEKHASHVWYEID